MKAFEEKTDREHPISVAEIIKYMDSYGISVERKAVYDDIVRYDKHPEKVQQAFDEADLVFCVDFGSTGRLDEMDHVLADCKAQRIVIDHHLAPNLEASVPIPYQAKQSLRLRK